MSNVALSVKTVGWLGISDVVPMSKEEKSDDDVVVFVFVFVFLEDSPVVKLKDESRFVSSKARNQLSWLVEGSQLSRLAVLWGSEDGTHSKLLKSRYGSKDTKKRPQKNEAFCLVDERGSRDATVTSAAIGDTDRWCLQEWRSFKYALRMAHGDISS